MGKNASNTQRRNHMKSKRRFLSLLVMTVMTAMLLSVPAFAKIKLDKKRIVMESDDNDVTLKLKGAIALVPVTMNKL